MRAPLTDLVPLLDALAPCRTFEAAATATLRGLAAMHDAFAAKSLYRQGRLRRAVVHLRPDNGYQGLFALEWKPEGAVEEVLTDPVCSSASAWRFLCQLEQPVLIDVALGTVTPMDSDLEQVSASGAFESQGTLARMRGRDTSQLLVLPIRAFADAVEGMVLLECVCKKAVGTTYIWPEALPSLAAAVRLAGPYLCGLQMRPLAEHYTHPLLPVIGTTLAKQVRFLRVFAAQDETILLQGPTGTGKSRIARWCHAVSGRADEPFVALDLNAIPTEMQKAELFGWKSGAFTGATRSHDGAVARARGGTLFIDELDKLSLDVQSSLLYLLEEGSYQALGDNAGPREANVRFIVATNADLGQAIASGQFLQDLYYRINVLPFRVPPLANRRDEIVAWAEFMLRRRAKTQESGLEIRLSAKAGQLLLEHSWPGNLRQLNNICLRAFSLALVDVFEVEPPASTLPIDGRHVEAAFRMESTAVVGEEEAGLWVAMQRAARRFAATAQQRHGEGGALDLDHTAAFRSMVLDAAIERTGTIEEAFAMVGREQLVRSRNHQRTLKEAAQKLGALRRALDAT